MQWSRRVKEQGRNKHRQCCVGQRRCNRHDWQNWGVVLQQAEGAMPAAVGLVTGASGIGTNLISYGHEQCTRVG
jgi:hypothetical protein